MRLGGNWPIWKPRNERHCLHALGAVQSTFKLMDTKSSVNCVKAKLSCRLFIRCVWLKRQCVFVPDGQPFWEAPVSDAHSLQKDQFPPSLKISLPGKPVGVDRVSTTPGVSEAGESRTKQQLSFSILPAAWISCPPAFPCWTSFLSLFWDSKKLTS